ncbi:hypothetical protein AAC387_Pa06g0222 [Persea americana]
MKWIKGCCGFLKHIRYPSEISNLGSSRYLLTNTWLHDDVCNTETSLNWKCLGIQSQARSLSSTPTHQDLRSRNSQSFKIPILANNGVHRFEGHLSTGGHQSLKQCYWSIIRQFVQTARKESRISRDWLVQQWLEDKSLEIARLKIRARASQHIPSKKTMFQNHPSFQPLFRKWFVGGSAAQERYDDLEKPFIEQPPFSQYAPGFLKPTSREEAKIAPLLARANLFITRDIEWANVMLGFEQESKYAIVDACYPQAPVGFIREQSNVIFRQLLGIRRPFVAYITDAMGNELFRVRRPIWFINSTIHAEVDGKEIGVVHRRWHLWRRIYDLYLGKRQFAVVENPGFWNWTFTLKDADENVLAEINRDWRGVGFEFLTDAGQYVIQFGHADPLSKTGPASAIQELEISRPLTLSERAVAIALAVSLDSDYFSRRRGGFLPYHFVGE